MSGSIAIIVEGTTPSGRKTLEILLRDIGRKGLESDEDPTMNSPEPADPLSRTLADWRVVPSRNPQFRAGVWARIEAGKIPATWSRYARAHPTMIGGVLAAAVVVGAFTGREQAKSRTEAESEQMAAAYVYALDARTMTLP